MSYGNFNLRKLIGQTVVEIKDMRLGSDDCKLITKEGNELRLYYRQDCCASCDIVQIDGDIEDLLDSPILMAEEVSNDCQDKPPGQDWQSESFTWTFYKFATVKGYVTLRWYGSSNGYYSESVTCLYNGKEDDRNPELYDRCVRLLDCCEKAKIPSYVLDTSELTRYTGTVDAYGEYKVVQACDKVEPYLGKLVYPVSGMNEDVKHV